MATEVKKPTAFTDGSSVWSNEGQAYDTATAGDETTYTDSTMAGDFDPSLLLYTWGTKGQTYTATVLKVKWDCLIAQSDDTWGIQYTKDGGSNWLDLLASGNNSSAVIVTEQASLDANQDLTLVQVKIISDQLKGADGHNVRIYDVWTEGEYTEVVEDLDVADPFEVVNITEDVELLLSDIILTGPLEEVAITEEVTAEVLAAAEDLGVDEFETVTVAEDVELVVSDVILDSPYEDVAIEEDVTAEITAQPDLGIDEFELISLEEYIETLGDSLLVDIFDTVSVLEDVTGQLAHEFVLSLSANFIDGAATTVQLTAPSGKVVGDFVAGKIHESSNPADSIDIIVDGYTELEFCFQATEYAGEVSYDFRVEGLDTYTVTPQLTVEAGAGGTLEVNVHDCAETETCLV